MQITVRQAATYLGVNEATLRRWINERDLPVHRVNERLHLNAIEVWEWAVEHGVPASRSLLEEAQRSPEQVPPLSELLEAGGVHRDIEGEDKSAAFAAIVQRPAALAGGGSRVPAHRARCAGSHGFDRHR